MAWVVTVAMMIDDADKMSSLFLHTPAVAEIMMMKADKKTALLLHILAVVNAKLPSYHHQYY